MRLFVGIGLPAEAAGELEHAVAQLRPAWPALRWTTREAWHLTLAFLGEVDEAVPARLARRLELAAARHSPLTLALTGAGAFPGADRARVLWTGVQGERRGLAALAATVAAGARRAGAPPLGEGRGFRPHLTLARCRIPVDVSSLVGELADYAGPPWTAAQIHLIRSLPGGQPRYDTLGSWSLREAARPRSREVS